jgi:hypothetical protein
VPAPEQNRKNDHKKSMCAKIRSNGEVSIESWRSHPILHPSKIGRLPSNQGQKLLAQVVLPWREFALVCKVVSRRMLMTAEQSSQWSILRRPASGISSAAVIAMDGGGGALALVLALILGLAAAFGSFSCLRPAEPFVVGHMKRTVAASMCLMDWREGTAAARTEVEDGGWSREVEAISGHQVHQVPSMDVQTGAASASRAGAISIAE